jgi:hypothetical protein
VKTGKDGLSIDETPARGMNFQKPRVFVIARLGNTNLHSNTIHCQAEATKTNSLALLLYLLINHRLDLQMRISPLFTQKILYKKYISITAAKINHWPGAK